MSTDAALYVSARLGRPYSTDEHCWWLVREVQRALFGRELPIVQIAEHLDALQLVRAFRDHPERKNWRDVPAPMHGAVVLMHRPGSRTRRAIHSGTYLALEGGGILHTDAEHGVTFDSPFDLTRVRNWRLEYHVPV